MNVFISGGCKNGKSFYAQRLARKQADESGRPLYYIATMIPHDSEDRARIRRHLAERDGWGFTTLECGKNLLSLLDDPQVDPSGAFLLDSVTALLSNEMFDERGDFDPDAAKRVREDLTEFAAKTGSTVFVSDYIYSDACAYSETVEAYRRGLAAADRALAAACDRVIEINGGNLEMRYIKGFLMAWGCFCRIPCPYRGWEEDNRYAMLNMFPLIGTALGVLVSVVWWLLSLLSAGSLLTGALLTFCYFWMTGFIHLDGFMDCSDAVLSRRPLSDRKRILKDSHVGAFAVISLCFMLLVFFASMTTLAESFSLAKAAMLCAMFTISRELSAYSVINRKPMHTSQYRSLSSHYYNEQGWPGLVITIIVCLILAVLPGSGLVGGSTAAVVAGSTGAAAGVSGAAGGFSVLRLIVLLWILLAQASLESLIGRRMRKQLGGMSGDVSGYMIVTSELTGILLLALVGGAVAL